MHEFIVKRCFRHAQVAEIVRLVAHDAKSKRWIRNRLTGNKWSITYPVSHSHIDLGLFCSKDLLPEIPELKKVGEDSETGD